MSPKQTFAEKKEAATEAVSKMHSALAEQIASGADWMDYLKFLRGFHNYSPTNTFWMWCQWEARKQDVRIVRALEVIFTGAATTPMLPEMTKCAGFSTWSDKGGKVRKGEKALSVLAPFTITDRDNLDADGKPRKKVIGFVLKNRTFDISQVEGIEVPAGSLDNPQTGFAPEGVWEKLVAIAALHGYPVDVAATGDGSHGFTHFGEKRIQIDPNFSDAHQCKVLAHEVAHLLLHAPDLLPRGMSTNTKEVEAESVAYMVMQAMGVEDPGCSFAYVGTWAGANGALIAATLERVVWTTARITTFIETGELPDRKESKFYRDALKAEADAEVAA